jgi:hypothetical protein
MRNPFAKKSEYLPSARAIRGRSLRASAESRQCGAHRNTVGETSRYATTMDVAQGWPRRKFSSIEFAFCMHNTSLASSNAEQMVHDSAWINGANNLQATETDRVMHFMTYAHSNVHTVIDLFHIC